LVARLQLQVTATGYGLLFAFFGVGAVGITVLLPAARRQWSEEGLVHGATVIFAASLFVLATSSSLGIAAGAMLIAGGMWLLILTTFNMAVHMSADEWVRGRALALYLMVLFGAMAGGSVLWGVVAEAIGVGAALQVSAGAIVLSTVLGQRYRLSDQRVRPVNLATPSQSRH
jgi:predicted MFS family arabinose efflux permease